MIQLEMLKREITETQQKRKEDINLCMVLNVMIIWNDEKKKKKRINSNRLIFG